MLLNFENLGEKTLNKIAEMALSTQIQKAERLTVKVKTDRILLAQGMLESLAIDGRGLVMNQYLRLQEMKINLNAIAVSPFKALMGNIQLTRPSQGTVCIVLSETDLETAYRSNQSQDKILEGIKCRVSSAGNITISLQTQPLENGMRKVLSLIIAPKIETIGDDVRIDILENEGISPELLEILLQKTREILNLNNFEIDGLSLNIERIEMKEGKLTLQGRAGITHFPSS